LKRSVQSSKLVIFARGMSLYSLVLERMSQVANE